jgi:hypothetical protein
MRRLPLALCLLLTPLGWPRPAVGAERTCPIPTCDPRLIGYRSIEGIPARGDIHVDGTLSEDAWAHSPLATGFIQGRPTPGAAATLRTEAAVLVGERGLYVGVRLFDADPARIVAPLLRRDNEGQSDWVFVEIDSRHDRRSAFSFGLNPKGVQVDGVFADDVNYDSEWNGIWEGAAQVDGTGWTAEFYIPFSQLAFARPARGDQSVWGFNVYRYSPAHGESSNWSPRFQGLPGVVSQFNELRLTVPVSPARFDATPFLAPKVTSSTTAASSFSGGLDVTAGLGSAFTATATVLPDFGQVEADPSQINLTTFELFQAERRPFFVEGAGAFAFPSGLNFTVRGNSFAEETPFYSRRVGRDGSRILGALKIAGRTANGWTIGAFSAAADMSSPSSSASGVPSLATTVVRATRTSVDGRAAIGFLGATAVAYGRTADVVSPDSETIAGADARYRSKDNRFEITGWVLGSRVSGSARALAAIARDTVHNFERTDATAHGPRDVGRDLAGAAGQIRLAKISGRFTWGVAGESISPAFEMNQIGFQRNADWRIVKGDWRYAWDTRAGAVRRWTLGSDDVGVGWNARGDIRAREADALLRADFRNFWDATVTWRRDLPALGTEWLRGGPAVWLPARDTIHVTIDSDVRKTWSLVLDAAAATESASGSSSVNVAPQISWRNGDHLAWSAGPSYSDETVGWYPAGSPSPGVNIVARRREQAISLICRSDVIFTTHAALQFYMQPFVSTGHYDRLQQFVGRSHIVADQFAPLDGGIDAIPAELAERTLNATVVFRWEYRPGSFVTTVWTRNEDILDAGRTSLASALRGFGAGGGTDVFLVKTSVHIGR